MKLNGKNMLHPVIAVTFCLALSVGFVASLYILVPSNVRNLGRNDHRQVKARMVAVVVFCFIATLSFRVFCQVLNYEAWWTLMGLVNWKTSRDVKVLWHSMQLFLGPLTVGGIQLFYAWAHDEFSFLPHGLSLLDFRDYIAAPTFEELVFRGCMTWPLLSVAQWSMLRVTFVAPLFFGCAHAHHAFLKLQQYPHQKLVILLSTLFQFTYTTMFGWYSTYAFIHTGSLLSVIASHSFCNLMGLPDLSFMTYKHTTRSMDHHDCDQVLHRLRYVLIAVYVLGIVLFARGFQNERIFDNQGGLLTILSQN